MNAYTKALKNVRPRVTRTWVVVCRSSFETRKLTGCKLSLRSEEREMTTSPPKTWHAREAKRWGWTYNKDGAWLCPNCDKEGG